MRRQNLADPTGSNKCDRPAQIRLFLHDWRVHSETGDTGQGTQQDPRESKAIHCQAEALGTTKGFMDFPAELRKIETFDFMLQNHEKKLLSELAEDKEYLERLVVDLSQTQFHPSRNMKMAKQQVIN